MSLGRARVFSFKRECWVLLAGFNIGVRRLWCVTNARLVFQSRTSPTRNGSELPVLDGRSRTMGLRRGRHGTYSGVAKD